jgi:hypothetical protein
MDLIGVRMLTSVLDMKVFNQRMDSINLSRAEELLMALQTLSHWSQNLQVKLTM